MSRSTDTIELLAGTPLFGTLTEAERMLVARQMRPVAYETGTLIFARGDPGADLYLVTAGRVRLSVYSSEGRELAFLNAGPGEIFGEIAALDGGVRTADAKTISKVKAMTLSRSALTRLIDTVPAVANAAIAFLCARLRHTNDVFEAMALHSLEVRVARFLLSASALRGVTAQTGQHKGRVTFDLAMSQSEIALLIGASRPKVNTALHALEADGVISLEGNRVTCDLEALARIAGRDDM